MDAFKEAVRSGLEEYLQSLERAIDGLTPAEARWQPTMHTNHIAWLVRNAPNGCYGRQTIRPPELFHDTINLNGQHFNSEDYPPPEKGA